MVIGRLDNATDHEAFCSVCHLQNVGRLGLEDRVHLLERGGERSV